MPLRASFLAVLLTGCWVSDQAVEDALDRDGDGFLPVEVGGRDCAPDDASIHPEALELCGDGIDNDCDGRVDDRGLGEHAYFLDEDGDGFGLSVTEVYACTAPEGHVEAEGDCDDSRVDRHPEVLDVCNGEDDDCDGVVDEDAPRTVRYRDADGDGRGAFDDVIDSCGEVDGYVLSDGDCDDADPTRHVGAVDLCDGIDQDCDGQIDDDATFAFYYPDADGDGWGIDVPGIESCVPLPDHAIRTGDCNDSLPGFHPEATDFCDGIDQDCDGAVDDDAIQTLYYPDLDGDGAGDSAAGFLACAPITTEVLVPGDCDDLDPTRHPAAVDFCDGIDQDCDGDLDDDATFTLWFADADGDNWGDGASAQLACSAPEGHVADDGDCDDAVPEVHPGVPEVCNSTDDDCDGLVDDGLVFRTYYADDDEDGLGDIDTGLATCALPPAGWVLAAGDCDDQDEGVQIPLWYADIDGDDFGAGVGVGACEAPPQHVADNRDCNDALAEVNLLAEEVCGNGRDDDCNRATDCDWRGAYTFADADHLLSPPANTTVGVLDDISDDRIAELWVARPSHTDVYFGPLPQSLSGPADVVLPAGCHPQVVRDAIEDDTPLVLCEDSSSVRLYGPDGVLYFTLDVPGPDDRPWAVSTLPRGLWIGRSTDIAFYTIDDAITENEDFQTRIDLRPDALATLTIDQQPTTLFVETDETVYLFESPDTAQGAGQADRTWDDTDAFSLTPYGFAAQQAVVVLRHDDQGAISTTGDLYTLDLPFIGEPHAFWGYPNEFVTPHAIPWPAAPALMAEVGETYKRFGYIPTMGKDNATTNAEAWFVDDQLDRSPRFLGSFPLTSTEGDLVFATDDGALHIFAHTAE